MTLPNLPIEIPLAERTPLVDWLLNLIAEQQSTIAKLEEKVNSLDEELKSVKKLKSKPKIRPSTLNQEEKKPKEEGKRAGSNKRSQKKSFIVTVCH